MTRRARFLDALAAWIELLWWAAAVGSVPVFLVACWLYTGSSTR